MRAAIQPATSKPDRGPDGGLRAVTEKPALLMRTASYMGCGRAGTIFAQHGARRPPREESRSLCRHAGLFAWASRLLQYDCRLHGPRLYLRELGGHSHQRVLMREGCGRMTIVEAESLARTMQAGFLATPKRIGASGHGAWQTAVKDCDGGRLPVSTDQRQRGDCQRGSRGCAGAARVGAEERSLTTFDWGQPAADAGPMRRLEQFLPRVQRAVPDDAECCSAHSGRAEWPAPRYCGRGRTHISLAGHGCGRAIGAARLRAAAEPGGHGWQRTTCFTDSCRLASWARCGALQRASAAGW